MLCVYGGMKGASIVGLIRGEGSVEIESCRPVTADIASWDVGLGSGLGLGPNTQSFDSVVYHHSCHCQMSLKTPSSSVWKLVCMNN